MSDPILQRSKKSGAYRVSEDDGATWKPTTVQRSKKSGAYRYSADDGGTWRAYSGALDDGLEAEPADDIEGEPINYPPSGAPAEVVDDEPEPVAAAEPTPQAPAPVAPAPPRPKQGGWDALARVQRSTNPVSMALDEPPAHDSEDVDILRGLGQGFTMRFGDEMAAAVTPEIDDGTGIPRTYAAGSAYADLRDTNRRKNETSRERSPWLYGGAEAIGMTPAAIATAPAFGPAGAGVPLRQMALQGAQQGAAIGAVSGAGGSEAEDLPELAEDTAVGGAGGAVAGAAAPYIGAGIMAGGRYVGSKAAGAWEALSNSQVGRGVADWAGDTAYKIRASAPGAYGSELKKLAKEQGIEFTDRELGEGIERVFPSQPGPLGIPKPRSARGFYEAAKSKKADLQELNSQAMRELDDQRVTVPVRKQDAGGLDEDPEVALMGAIEAAKARARQLGNLDSAPLLARIKQIEQQVIAPRVAGQIRIPATLAYKLKVDLDAAGYPKGAIASTSDSIRAQAHRAAADGPRSAFYDAVKKQAEPATEAAVQQVQRDYPIVAMAEEMALGRAAQESGNQQLSLPSVIGAVVEGPAAVPRIGAWEALKTYGKDASANTLRGVERALTPAERTAAAPVYGPARAPFADEAARGTAQAATASGRAMAPAAPQTASAWETLAGMGRSAAAAEQSPEQRAQASEHHRAPQMIRNALKAYPQALGRFKGQLQAVEGDPEEMGRVVAELLRDPEFRDRIMPELQKVDDVAAKRGGLRR